MEYSNLMSAKEMFRLYRGCHYYMVHDGVYSDYKKFNVPREVEHEWLQEMKKEAFDNLNQASNNKSRADAFAKYGDLIKLLKDSKGLKYMVDYNRKNIHLFDSNTLLLNVLMIIDTARALEDSKLASEVKNEVLTILKNALKKPIYISDDYRENGAFPDYLTDEKIASNMKSAIQYWENRELK